MYVCLFSENKSSEEEGNVAIKKEKKTITSHLKQSVSMCMLELGSSLSTLTLVIERDGFVSSK